MFLPSCGDIVRKGRHVRDLYCLQSSAKAKLKLSQRARGKGYFVMLIEIYTHLNPVSVDVLS